MASNNPAMTRGRLALTFGACVGISSSAQAAAPAYVRSTVGAPWDSTENEAAMDLVFSAGTWDDLRYETVDPDELFSPAYNFIYLEGGDDNASELEAFLGANQMALEAWVGGGGGLFINAAPNEGGDQDWGFGGVTLTYPDVTADPVAVADFLHPAINGPYLPWAISYTGDSVGHATLAGPALVDLLVDADGGDPHLAELTGEGGRVILGGLTTSNFWDPEPEARNQRANVIAYLGAHDEDGDNVIHAFDNCPDDANPLQQNDDGDLFGNACDPCPDDPDDDADGDSLCADVDNCPDNPNPMQQNTDGDELGDVCDPCPNDPANDADGDSLCADVDNCPDDPNPMQQNADGDELGDACDGCPNDPDDDADGDQFCADMDNCPDDFNPDQMDADDDGVGDACDTVGTTGGSSTGTESGETGDPPDGTTGNATTGGPAPPLTSSSGPTTQSSTTSPDPETDTDDPDGTEEGGADGCACGAGSMPPPWWPLVLLGLLGLLPRRSTSKSGSTAGARRAWDRPWFGSSRCRIETPATTRSQRRSARSRSVRGAIGGWLRRPMGRVLLVGRTSTRR